MKVHVNGNVAVEIKIDGETHVVDIEALSDDLAADGLVFQSLATDGELRVRDGNRVERWQARVEGCGANNTYWGDLPGGYEFCSSTATFIGR